MPVLTKGKRGFASMDPQRLREVTSKGGSMSGGNFKNDREKAARAGRVGGSRKRVRIEKHQIREVN